MKHLGLHMDANKLTMLIADLAGEGVTRQDYKMLIASQHMMDQDTAKSAMSKAQQQRRLEQIARAKLFHIKGNEIKVHFALHDECR